MADRATPGPLDNLPRPLRERERGGTGRRRLGAVALAAVTAVVGVTVGISMTTGPLTPVGAVHGAVATPGPTTRPSTTAVVPSVGTRPAAPTPTPTPKPVATPAAVEGLIGYQSPLPRGRLTLPFGRSPWGSRLVDGEKVHDGIDLATFCGDRIVAAHSGTVLAAGRRYDRQMGWVGDLQPYFDRLDRKRLWSTLPIVVVIDDGNGYRSVYAHFGKVVVTRDETVKAGQLIGFEGRTGRASGCHLHYGLFSPLETATFRIDPAVVRRMKVPDRQIARVDPLLVLPGHASSSPAPGTSPDSP